tara:strand:- start:632 stop:1249 length:618 start_codon:yes stop_codon:yes gene_type:complete
MALVSASTLREYLPEISDNTEVDADLNSLIERVENGIAYYLGFPQLDSLLSPTLESNTYTLYVNSPTIRDPYTLQLPIIAVSSVTSVHADDDRSYGTGTLIDASTYELDKSLGRIRLIPDKVTRSFSYGYRSNKVVCVAGYTSGTVPGSLVHAICVYAAHLHRNKNNQGKESITSRNGSIRLSKKSMPLSVKEFLWPFRAPSTIF